MKELVVISGKGGTGKTSIVAGFAALARGAVLADCDVDAADLHLILTPKVLKREEFRSSKEARIRPEDCTGCGRCEEVCRFGAVRRDGQVYSVDPVSCEGCKVCVTQCPEEAIDFFEKVSGDWMVSETRFGAMVHAALGMGADNSGKLVSVVRREAKKLAAERGLSLVMIDGPPGIGCPVIASVAGVNHALIVAEPTQSGLHDMKRAAGLLRHFSIPGMLVVNKFDINREIARTIEEEAERGGLESVGRVPYDPAFTRAMIQGKSVVEFSDGRAGEEVTALWEKVRERIGS